MSTHKELNTDLIHNLKMVKDLVPTQRIRDFEEVKKEFKMHESETQLPIRADLESAGYDFYSKESVDIPPNSSHVFWTDVKAYMQPNEFLDIRIRSSLGNNNSLMLKNTTGVIDKSYYNNRKNDGNIAICIYNFSNEVKFIAKGERIAQGIFSHYLLTDNDQVLHEERIGGSGSSNR